jgi:hypothetical protein
MQVELQEMGVVENMMQAEFTSEDMRNTRSLRLIRNDPKTLAVRQAQGYKIVLDPEGTHIKTFLPRQPDGSYRFGDVVLAQCPTDLREKRMARARRKAELLDLSIKDTFHTEMERMDVPSFETTGDEEKERR